jgi:hypothetical protein
MRVDWERALLIVLDVLETKFSGSLLVISGDISVHNITSSFEKTETSLVVVDMIKMCL